MAVNSGERSESTAGLRGLVEFLFPECCPACGGSTPAGFCPGCRGDFRRSGGDGPLRFGRGAEPLAAIVAPFRYAPPLDRHVQALKFGGARRLGRALGLLLADVVAPRAAGRDALVPVPLHPARLRERGYNQAVEIARPLAARFRLPLLLHGISRSRSTPPQTGLDARARARNVRGAFAVRRPLDNLRLAIVDDVFTTGATLRALAAALRAAGAADVEAWAVARTPPPHDR